MQRLAIDVRQLNDLSADLPASIPSFDELTANQKGKHMSSPDQRSVCHYSRFTEESDSLTCFTTECTHYCFNALAFGLKNAAKTFFARYLIHPGA